MSRIIDHIDHRILTRLKRDGGMTHQDLSEAIGRLPLSFLCRQHQLKVDNMIFRYVALIYRSKSAFR